MADPEPFGLVFSEAVAFLRDRLGISGADWQAILEGVDAASGEIAGGMADAFERDIQDAVLRAVEEGTTAATFREDYDRIVAENGWQVDEDKAAWHADLIFRVQTLSAYSAGRWAQIQRLKAVRPYIRYVTAGDHRVRATHREWHGVVLAADHPFWLTHWPLNGFNCRCYTQSLSERDLARFGYKVTPDGFEGLAVPPDEGWSGNVGVAWERLRARA